jgi:hypothetical protein
MNNEALVHAYNPLRERLMGTKLQDRKERKYSFLLDTHVRGWKPELPQMRL